MKLVLRAVFHKNIMDIWIKLIKLNYLQNTFF